ncbi:hypothetical protein [Leptolyngbya sp. FACHB-671]|nr:hypothetical protein [Leptolyngbya sp. FACHB-671]
MILEHKTAPDFFMALWKKPTTRWGIDALSAVVEGDRSNRSI